MPNLKESLWFFFIFPKICHSFAKTKTIKNMESDPLRSLPDRIIIN